MNRPDHEFSTQRRRTLEYTVLFFAAILALWKFCEALRVWDPSPAASEAWWTCLLILGTMISGFVFQPLIRRAFPTIADARGTEDQTQLLRDHETLLGYYPVVALVVFTESILVSPALFGTQLVFRVASAYFWWSSIASGLLNLAIFYLFTKALRYGDMSLVSVIQALTPIVALPISYLLYATIGIEAGLGDPHVSSVGGLGIALVIGAIIINVLIQRKAPRRIVSPHEDRLARHPMLAGVLSTVFAAIAINFDKVAVDSGNPF